MSNENKQTSELGNDKVESSGGFDFSAVIVKLKDLSSFVSLDGKALTNEYWSTFVMLALPFVLLAVVFTVIAIYFTNPFTVLLGACVALASTCLVLVNLLMFPVMVRRLHDAKVNAWLAVICLALAAVPCPYLGFASGIIILVTGFLPSKADAVEIPAVGVVEKTKMWILGVMFTVLAAAMVGNLLNRSISLYNIQHNIDKIGRLLKEEGVKNKKHLKKDEPQTESLDSITTNVKNVDLTSTLKDAGGSSKK